MSEIIQGDCIEEMKQMEEESVDAVVTDPPYGLAFMGKSWDDFEPKEFQNFCEEWGKQALRVLKPGGYLLAFCGTRTYHRMVVGLEDAGFDIKDQIDWMYGQGFPKSHDISKAIDKHFDKEDEREVVGEKPYDINTNVQGGKFSVESENKREGYIKGKIKEPATPQAKNWQGWGTALKPSHEPIVVAQKPRENTYAENVLKYGVGGLNIDGCRIGTEEISQHGRSESENVAMSGKNYSEEEGCRSWEGRWPANVVLDPQAAEMLDRQSGFLDTGGQTLGKRDSEGLYGLKGHTNVSYSDEDGGGASRFFKTVGFNSSEISDLRFFYSAKAHKSERNAGLEELEDVNMGQSGGARQKLKEGEDEYQQEDPSVGLNKIKKVKNDIATLKPINLMRWLVRLVTPEDGTVLDPFAGSGTTGCACEIDDFDYILIEKRERFANLIAPKRCEYWSNPENWKELKDHEEVPDTEELRNGKLNDFTS